MFTYPSPRKGKRKNLVFYGNGRDGSPDIVGNSVANFYNIELNEGFSSDVTDVSVSTVLNVRDGAGFSTGDLVILHSTQVDSLGQETTAGQYDFNTIVGVNGNEITLKNTPTNTYKSNANGNQALNAKTQLVKVCQFENLNIPTGYTLGTKAWDGFSGGILAFYLTGNLTGDGTISAYARGFRGGAANNTGSTTRPGEGWTGLNTESYPGGSDVTLNAIDTGGFGKVVIGSNSAAGGGGNATGGSGLGHGDIDENLRLTLGGGGGGYTRTGFASANGTGSRGGGIVLARFRDSLFSGLIDVRGEVTTRSSGVGGVSVDSGGGAGGSALVEHPGGFIQNNVLITGGTVNGGQQGGLGQRLIQSPC